VADIKNVMAELKRQLDQIGYQFIEENRAGHARVMGAVDLVGKEIDKIVIRLHALENRVTDIEKRSKNEGEN
jgi:hypothetical protein